MTGIREGLDFFHQRGVDRDHLLAILDKLAPGEDLSDIEYAELTGEAQDAINQLRAAAGDPVSTEEQAAREQVSQLNAGDGQPQVPGPVPPGESLDPAINNAHANGAEVQPIPNAPAGEGQVQRIPNAPTGDGQVQPLDAGTQNASDPGDVPPAA